MDFIPAREHAERSCSHAGLSEAREEDGKVGEGGGVWKGGREKNEARVRH